MMRDATGCDVRHISCRADTCGARLVVRRAANEAILAESTSNLHPQRMSALELFAAVLGAISVYLSVRQNIWSWPTAIVNVVVYAVVFYWIPSCRVPAWWHSG